MNGLPSYFCTDLSTKRIPDLLDLWDRRHTYGKRIPRKADRFAWKSYFHLTPEECEGIVDYITNDSNFTNTVQLFFESRPQRQVYFRSSVRRVEVFAGLIASQYESWKTKNPVEEIYDAYRGCEVTFQQKLQARDAEIASLRRQITALETEIEDLERHFYQTGWSPQFMFSPPKRRIKK